MTTIATRARTNELPEPSEDDIQKAVVKWLQVEEALGRLTYFAVPNEAKRGWGTINRLQAMGLRSGVYVLCIIWPRGFGFIEMKTRTGKPTGNQLAWDARFTDFQVPHAICRSVDDVMQTVNEWMSK